MKAEPRDDEPRTRRRRNPRRKRNQPSTPRKPDLAHAPAAPLVVTGDSKPVSAKSSVPRFLRRIYYAAANEYGVRWEILAAINEIETGYGRNLNVSSAGAVGWMQFLPSTWRVYGVDADGDGRKDPYDPKDAVFAAARYLRAAGYEHDVRRAIYAYNHAWWYVDAVMLTARMIATDGLSLPRARRLDAGFAARLARIADRSGVPWELMLAVLRVRGNDGRVPASRAELRALARRLARLGARSHPRRAIRRLARKMASKTESEPRLLARDATFAERVVALAHYNKAVGLEGLVRGLSAIRGQLARRVLRSERLVIYPGGRADIASGVTDVRVLVLLRYLASRYREVTVTSLTTGHSFLTASGNVSAHSYGRAVDIAALNGTPVLGHQQRGGLTQRALWSMLLLPEEVEPSELISLFELGGPSFALADHADHIHAGY